MVFFISRKKQHPERRSGRDRRVLDDKTYFIEGGVERRTRHDRRNAAGTAGMLPILTEWGNVRFVSKTTH